MSETTKKWLDAIFSAIVAFLTALLVTSCTLGF